MAVCGWPVSSLTVKPYLAHYVCFQVKAVNIDGWLSYKIYFGNGG